MEEEVKCRRKCQMICSHRVWHKREKCYDMAAPCVNDIVGEWECFTNKEFEEDRELREQERLGSRSW